MKEKLIQQLISLDETRDKIESHLTMQEYQDFCDSLETVKTYIKDVIIKIKK
jgi:hypothetical protein